MRRAALALVLGGCAATEHSPVDIQLDVRAPIPDGTEFVRFCVDDGPTRPFGAAAGRFALTGLATDRPQVLTVDALDHDQAVLARVEPLELETGYMQASLADCATGDCGEPCDSADVTPPEGETTWVLGLRFQSPSPW